MKVYSIEDTTNITTEVYNLISIIAFLRNQQLELNQKFSFNVYSSGKIKPIEMIVIDKEDIMFNSKKNSCFILAPLYLNKNDSKDKRGDIKLWISESNNLPQLSHSHINSSSESGMISGSFSVNSTSNFSLAKFGINSTSSAPYTLE